MATTESPIARHVALGLTDADVLDMYRGMLLARAVDERMWLMQRAGKIAFIHSISGYLIHSDKGLRRLSWKPSVVFQNSWKPPSGRKNRISPPQTTM